MLSANWLLKESSQVGLLRASCPRGRRPALDLGDFSIHPNQIAGTITLLLPLFLALLLDAPPISSAKGRLIRVGLSRRPWLWVWRYC